MTANDDHWPSLPPIRTSSYNTRVSCETFNSHTSPVPPPAPASPLTHTLSFTSLWRLKPASKSADALPFGSHDIFPSRSHTFSSCFPQTPSKGHGHDRKKAGTQTHGGVLDAAALLRSIFGFSSPMVSFTNGASPSNWQTPPSMTSSPSGHMKPSGVMSPLSSMRSAGATPHSGGVLRSSKGHSAHTHGFTMMPRDVVGKKKPVGYESNEPTSPEVSCIGRVRSKASWDALVKDKHKAACKKKGKTKRLSGETLRRSDFDACGNKHEDGQSTATGNWSEPRRSHECEGFSTNFDEHAQSHKDFTKGDLLQGMGNTYNNQALRGSWNSDAHMYCGECADGDAPPCLKSQSGIVELESKLSSSQGDGVEHLEHHGDFEASLYDKNAEPGASDGESDALAHLSESLPPSNCLLLMKKGSRNRSAHYDFGQQPGQEPGHAINQWTWGQVLT